MTMYPEKFTNWRKSSRSGGGDNCIEVAFALDGTLGMRDSKDRTGPVLGFTRGEWTAFTGGIRESDFDAH
ncbi:DUF397 domain-containing protein [Solwaraspora sp. WMMD406]|uniref:DUF397 domain-containing protein n=1 Tax=Solwaraspora sp. WMMD406 TaxID=3016095 RepID=UPI002416AA6A|nr:DUF397 domain-containing protein [Solwaraspora sp. WMMD406]MDG4764199.1 DUF397 domain-containing protein [Solwaraspora sp. WMMD406]